MSPDRARKYDEDEECGEGGAGEQESPPGHVADDGQGDGSVRRDGGEEEPREDDGEDVADGPEGVEIDEVATPALGGEVFREVGGVDGEGTAEADAGQEP